MKILLTGATGLLGSATTPWLMERRPDLELTLTSRHEPGERFKKLWRAIDLTDREATYSAITKLNPDVVVHLAAMSLPDPCQTNPEEAFRANFLGARNVALACDRFDAELLFLSTDQTFYGAHPELAHGEYDKTKPANIYGQTKILAENYIRSHLRRYYIVRTGKIFGGPNDTRSIVHKLFTAFKADDPFDVAKDWRAHLTHASYLAQALVQLIEKKTYGIYHVVSPGVPSYFEIAEYLLGLMKRPSHLAHPISALTLNLPAARASRCELSAKLWEADFNSSLQSWQEGIKLFLKERFC